MKYALIFGASGDIGTACAKKLASQGWSLYLHYYQNEAKVTALQNELSLLYGKQDFYRVGLNMCEDQQLDLFLTDLFQVDAIIFAQGKTIYKLLDETTSQEMDELWESMLKTPMLICQKLQSKLAQVNGRIIFISSIYGLMGSSMEVLYSTIKGAQHSFVDAYAQEVASQGITVNAVAPGAVNTKMNQEWTEKETLELIENIPFQRMAEPFEIAAAVAFLVQEDTSYITGSILPVTGGWRV